MSRMPGAAAVLLLLAGAAAGQGPPRDLRGADFREIFRPIIKDQHRSVVAIRSESGGVRSEILGTVIDGRGGILTKSSEVGEQVEVRIGWRWTPAAVAARLPRLDLALLRVENAGSRPAIAFEPSSLRVGQWVVTVGMLRTPAGAGVVSAEADLGSIPGWLGIQCGDDRRGAKIGKVESSSPAEQAGLQTGDVITAVEDTPVPGKAGLLRLLKGHKAGDTVRLSIFRDYDELSVAATLGWPPVEITGSGMGGGRQGLHGPLSRRRTGFPGAVRHDTAIDPSRCGGPVLDSSGRAVGINIARVSRTHTALLDAATVQTAIGELLELEGNR